MNIYEPNKPVFLLDGEDGETRDVFKQIQDIVKDEYIRQNEGLELIASENYTYPNVMKLAGSILTNKYAEGYPDKRYYGGCEEVDKVEKIAIDQVCKLFGCKYANVQPHSGSQANQAAFNAVLRPGDKVLGMDLSHGGHLTHGSKVNVSGKFYESYFYGVDENGFIDYDNIMSIAKEVKPKLIICGASAYARTINFKKFREIADEVGAYLLADIAHIAGLVVTGLHPSPIGIADIVTTTTHKTLRGTRGGVVMTDNEELYKKINSALFPGLQGGPLMHIVGAKAVGFTYNLTDDYKAYMYQVKLNAAVMCEQLKKRGIKIVSDGTDNHLMLLDFKDEQFSGKDAQLKLEEIKITANKNTVPGETRSPFVTSGLRIGTPAITARGIKEDDCVKIADIIADCLYDKDTKENLIKRVYNITSKHLLNLM